MKKSTFHTLLVIAVLAIFPVSSLADDKTDDVSKEYFDLMGRADKAIKDGKWADAETVHRRNMPRSSRCP